MYVALVPNRTSPPAILLRESFRQDGKVKNRTLANLSAWPSARIDALRRLLRGDLDTARAGDPISGPVFGLLFALKHLADDLGLTKAIGPSRRGKLSLFVLLARLAQQGSSVSALCWARDQAVAEVLGLGAFEEDDLEAALDDLAARQEAIEQALYRNALTRRSAPRALFLCEVTSTYQAGEPSSLGRAGHHPAGGPGASRPAIWLVADGDGDPLAVRVFAGDTQDPATLLEQITTLTQQFGVDELVDLRQEDGSVVLARREGPIDQALDLARCAAVVTDVAADRMSAQAVHDAYVSSQRAARDVRQMLAELLDRGPVSGRETRRTRGEVFACMLALKIRRELERRLHAVSATTNAPLHAITPADAMAALSRLCLLEYPLDAQATVTRLPKPDARQQEILAALGLHLPQK
jgi:hypothetical protein